MSAPISVLILTKNEETNILGCIDSVCWSDDIVILDSGSSDSTVSLAKSRGCRVFHRPFDNWADHQNWAVRNVSFLHPWVFNIDADERVGAECTGEMVAAVAADGPVAFRLRRKDYFRGVWLKHATFYPTWLIRLYRPASVEFQRLVNPVTVVAGPVGNLQTHIEHWPFSKGISYWLERHNSYSTFESIEYLKRPSVSVRNLFSRDSNRRRQTLKGMFVRMPARPLLKFLYLYLLHLGFLDGRSGLHYCLLQSFYELMISLKVIESTDFDRAQLERPAPTCGTTAGNSALP